MQKLIYIADDEKNIRELIAGFLKNDGYEVVAFENGDRLLSAFVAKPSDLVVLDIMMEGTDGLTICSKIREKHNVPIIIVSARDSELDRITGITMGSDDYLVKPFSPIELLARVKAIFRRIQLDRGMNASPVLSFGDIEINTDTKLSLQKGMRFELTPTEFALMVYLIQNKDKAVSREELLKNVWQFDFEADTRATDDVIKRLRKKLTNSIVKISSVWGYGFKLELEDNCENN